MLVDGSLLLEIYFCMHGINIVLVLAAGHIVLTNPVQGKYAEALRCMERALVLRQHFFGEDSEEVRLQWQS